MNDRQLSSFIETAKRGSFSKAASVLFISPAALIQQINLLERDLGFPLFNRTNHGVTLTENGVHFLTSAKKIISLYEEARCYGLNNDKNQHYHIRIALPEEGLPTRFLCAFRQFRQEYPQSEIMFPFFPFSTHLKAIANGDVDLSIAAEYRPEYIENLTFIPLMRDTYSFLMREENPLSRLPIIHKEDLRNQHIITGRYDGIAQPFKDALPPYAEIEELDNAYNTETRFQSYYRDVLTIIHSSWANNFKPYFHVVPSDIDAGNIGIFCARSPSKGVKALVKLLADI